MSHFTVDGLATHLERTFGGHAVTDTDAKGQVVLNFHISNPNEPRHPVTMTAHEYRGSVTLCSLWFGQVEVSRALDPARLTPAIEAILGGEIVAVARYKNRDAFDGRHKAERGRSAWLYQIPDDTEALDAMKKKLGTPASFGERLADRMTGVFEVYDWTCSSVFER